MKASPRPPAASSEFDSDVRAATGLDRSEALAILDRLVKDGRLSRTGQRRGAKYHRA